MVQGYSRLADHVIADAIVPLHIFVPEHIADNIQHNKRQYHGGNISVELWSVRDDVHSLER